MTRRRRTTLRVLPFAVRVPPPPAPPSDEAALREQIDRLMAVYPHGLKTLQIVAHTLLKKYDPDYRTEHATEGWW